MTPERGDAKPLKLSREETERLCLVHAVSTAPRTFAELAESLGFSAQLATVMKEAVSPLIHAGQLEVLQDGRVCATEDGRAWLRRRLSDAGVV
jgi:hypothetical protein